MAVSSAGLGPKSDCSGKAQKQLYSKLQTHPLVRESAPHQEPRNCQTENKNLVMVSRWEPDTKTDWPTHRRSYIHFNFMQSRFCSYAINSSQTQERSKWVLAVKARICRLRIRYAVDKVALQWLFPGHFTSLLCSILIHHQRLR
jgi:hypothetical protein